MALYRNILVLCEVILVIVLFHVLLYKDVEVVKTCNHGFSATDQTTELRHLVATVEEMMHESRLNQHVLQQLGQHMKSLTESITVHNHQLDIGGQIESVHFEISALREILYRLEDANRRHINLNIGRLMTNATTADDGNRTSENLNRNVRILCYIPVSDDKVNTTVSPILETWGKRCNKLLFFAHKPVHGLPVVGLNVKEMGKYDLAKKMFAAMYYLYTHYLDEYDWFMKADTDTYVVMENLRQLVAGYRPSEAIYFGHPFQIGLKHWVSGGAGYIISREGLRRYGEHGYRHKCLPTNGAEDLAVGKCMEVLVVQQGESRDSLGRTRFHCLNPLDHIVGNFPWWMFRLNKHPPQKGLGNISDTAISFHNMTGWGLYMLDYFIYHLQHHESPGWVQTLSPGNKTIQQNIYINHIKKP